MNTASFIIALYGAILSTWIWYGRRPKIRIRMDQAERPDRPPGYSVFLVNHNLAEKAVNIVCFWLKVRTQVISFEDRFESTPQLPTTISPGNNCYVWVDQEHVDEELLKLGLTGTVDVVPMFSDATGKKYRGRRFKVTVESKPLTK